MRTLERLIASSLVACLLSACSPAATELRSVAGLAQGTTYSLQWVGGADESAIAIAADRELARIDAMLSNYRPDSEIERFNAQRSTETMVLSAELVELLGVAKSIHAASDGCFDPTVRPLVRAWGFDGDSPAVPTAEALAVARAAIGLDRLVIEGPSRARKADPNLEIDMSSIGQGYAAERLATLLEEHGSTSYLAEIGGEIVARGTKPNETPWRIGVENPGEDGKPGARLEVPRERRTVVITSGTYRHFFDGEGRRYGHVIDPRTGAPIDHDLLSVTVVGADGSRTAAWATALLCLGPERALATAEREGLAAMLWVVPPDGSSSRHETSALTTGEWRGLLE